MRILLNLYLSEKGEVYNISEYLNVLGWNMLDIWYDDLDKSDRVIFSEKKYTFIGAIYSRS